jgi:hypothetical protein
MNSRFVFVTFGALLVLPIPGVAQDEEVTPVDREDAIILLDPNAEGLGQGRR